MVSKPKEAKEIVREVKIDADSDYKDHCVVLVALCPQGHLHPINEGAKHLAEIAGTKYLSAAALAHAITMGIPTGFGTDTERVSREAITAKVSEIEEIIERVKPKPATPPTMQ